MSHSYRKWVTANQQQIKQTWYVHDSPGEVQFKVLKALNSSCTLLNIAKQVLILDISYRHPSKGYQAPRKNCKSMPSWEGSIRITESNSWPHTGHPKNHTTQLRALYKLLKLRLVP